MGVYPIKDPGYLAPDYNLLSDTPMKKFLS